MFEFKSDLLTLEPCNIVGWDILVSIDVCWPFLLILIVYGPGVVFVKHWDMLYFG